MFYPLDGDPHGRREEVEISGLQERRIWIREVDDEETPGAEGPAGRQFLLPMASAGFAVLAGLGRVRVVLRKVN